MEHAGWASDLPVDHRLPSLASLLDPPALTAAISRALSATGGPEFRGAEISYLRYKPGQSLLIGVSGFVSDPPPETSPRGAVRNIGEFDGAGRCYYTVKACADMDHHRTLLKKWGSRRQLAPTQGPAVIELPALRAVAVAFPNDAALPGLKVIANSERLQHCLTDCVLTGRERAREHKFELIPVKYKPERRFVARLRVGVRDESTMERRKQWMYVRAYAGSTGDAGLQALAELARIGTDGARLAAFVPRSLGHDPSLGIHFQEELPGTPLVDQLPRLDATWIHAIGARLRELHGLPAAFAVTASPSGLVAQVRQTVDHLGALDAETGRLAQRLFGALCSHDHVQEATVPSHGDFYYHQLLIAPDGVRVVDFDEACMADPALDVGNFLAHLDWLATSGRLELSQIPEVRSAFLEGYGRAPANLPFYEMLARLRLAARPFRNLVPDWRTRTREALRGPGC